MRITQNKPTISEKKIQKAVDTNFKKYKKTYQLLEEYDKSPETTPKYPAKRRALQDALQQVSS